MTTHPIDWSNLEEWGQPATCVHHAAWCADRHTDEVNDQ